MNTLTQKFQGDEMLSLTQKIFRLSSLKKNSLYKSNNYSDIAPVSTLINTANKGKNNCIFCEKFRK